MKRSCLNVTVPFCTGAYKWDVIKMCLYLWCLFCVGAYYPGFTVEQEIVVLYTCPNY